MAILRLKKLFGSGGAGLATGELRRSLAALIRYVGGVGAPDTTWWQTGIAVTSNAVTLAGAGRVLTVEATAGTAAGPKQIVSTAAPAAGRVRVQYSAAGVPTLTFNGTDAITACAVQQLGYSGDSFTVE